MVEAAVVLKDKSRLRTDAASCSVPINRVRIIDSKICHHRLTVYLHVSRRREVSVLDVLQIAFQRLLRRTTRAGIPLNRSLIDHDRKSKTRMALCLRHHQLRCLVHRIPRPIPIDDHPVDAAADHVINLTLHLSWVRGAVANIHVPWPTKPEHQMGIDLRSGSRIEQRVNIHLADAPRASIAV
jgi:hypothetical protein